MQHLHRSPEGKNCSLDSCTCNSSLGKWFLAYHRIKPYVPPLVSAPLSIPLSFTVAGVFPRWNAQRFRFATDNISPIASIHRLPCDYQGILFDTRTFEPQRQLCPGTMPRDRSIFVISKLPAGAWTVSQSSNGTSPSGTPTHRRLAGRYPANKFSMGRIPILTN